MAGTLSEADLVADLKTSLFDTAAAFESEGDADFKRFLAQSLPDMEIKRPVTKLGTLTLVADEPRIAIEEADFAALKTDLWRNPRLLPKPWEPTHPGPLPCIRAQRDEDGWWIELDPAPTAAHISVLGSSFKFWYFARHAIGVLAGDTTVAAEDRSLLLLRAQAEAMLALGVRNAGKPVQLRESLSGVARNSTPTALYEQLLKRFWEIR